MTGASDTERPKILLIDDSVVDLHVLLEMLSRQSFNLHVAFDGRDGVEKAELLLPDLILLDVMMPEMDGLATCRQLKSSPRTQSIPVIFLTASTELDRRIEGLTAGGVDYITKPFYPEEVIARVQIHLNLSRAHRAPHNSVKGSEINEEKGISSRSLRITRAAIKIIRASLANPPSSSELAKMIGTNERALVAAFQSQFTLSVSDWLREERMRVSKHLLVTTDTAIGSISEHVGFSSQANFAKAFRLRFGFTPREIRQLAYQNRSIDIDES